MGRVECEVWKSVEGYEGLYEVSNTGKIKSIKRPRITKGGGITIVPERILKPKTNKFGYCTVALSKNAKHKFYMVHRLVAFAFVPNPEGKPEINHKDGNKLNNSVQNLEWCTSQENKRHAYENGLCGGEHITHRRQVNQYDKDYNFIATYASIEEASKQTGIGHSSIWMCCNHRYKTAGNFIWSYAQERRSGNEIC